MLPKHGVAHAVFLLAYTAQLARRLSFDAWLQAAQAQPSFMAAALDLRPFAETLIKLRLADVSDHVRLAASLQNLSATADRATLLRIAQILFSSAPPAWLWSAVSGGAVAREYIPTEDLEDLQWLEPDLDRLLLAVHSTLDADRQDTIRKRIGDAAEYILVAAFTKAGRDPLHVAQLWDGFGYDIELRCSPLERIEVKAASTATAGRFRITRNEFDKSKLYGPEWRLIQVVFSNSAFVASVIGAADVASVREISAGDLCQIVPPDTEAFKWTDSAEIEAPPSLWKPAELALDPEFKTAGFRTG